MPIADLTPSNAPVPTDEKCCIKLLRITIRMIRQNRDAFNRMSNIIANAPGGQAGCLSSLTTNFSAETQAEAIAVLDKLVVLLNTHKGIGITDVSNPLA